MDACMCSKHALIFDVNNVLKPPRCAANGARVTQTCRAHFRMCVYACACVRAVLFVTLEQV